MNREESFIFRNGAYIIYYVSLLGIILNLVISILFLTNYQYLLTIWSIIASLVIPKSMLGIILLLGREESIYLNMSPLLYNCFPKTCQKYRFILGKEVIKGYIKEVFLLFIGFSPIILYSLSNKDNF